MSPDQNPVLLLASSIPPESALSLVLMALGAIAMPALAKSLRIPVAVAEICYGLLIGPTLFGWIGQNDFIAFLADVGFAFFMFLAGLEIDFRGFNFKGLRRGLTMALLSCLAYALMFGFGHIQGWSSWVALAAGATSVGLLVAVVRETSVGGTPLGNLMLAQAAIGEAVTIVLLTFFTIGEHAEGTVDVLVGIGMLLGLVAAMFFVLLTLRTLLWWFPKPFTRMVAHEDPAEFGMRVGIGLMFAFVGLSMLAHVEPFLGAFIAGVLLTFVIREKGALEHKLNSMGYGFFVPIFFIDVGIQMELSFAVLSENAGEIGLIVLMMLVAKFVPTLYYRRQGVEMRSIVAMSALLAAPLTLLIAIIDIAFRIEAVDADLRSVVVTAGILASLLYPSLARSLLKSPKLGQDREPAG